MIWASQRRIHPPADTYTITRAASNADLVVAAELVSRGFLGNLLQELEALLGPDSGALHLVDELMELALEVAERGWGS